MTKTLRWQLNVFFYAFCFGAPLPGFASESPGVVAHTVPSRLEPVILTGAALTRLVRVPLSRIAVYAWQQGEFRPIPFQLDRRDSDGNFQIPSSKTESTEDDAAKFDANDECVFMAADAGDKAPRGHDMRAAVSLTEIEVRGAAAGQSRWAYAAALAAPRLARAGANYVGYDKTNDTVTSAAYRVRFSPEQPFLVSTLSLKDPHSDQWSANLLDTMKVRHAGKLFGRFDFVRTQADYRSRLVAVKVGPVRVIRRTANRVHVLGWLRTPTIHIDYLCYRRGVTMDLLIDVPFRIGWFFSGMLTRMTMDWNGTADFPATRIYSRSFPEGVPISGKMSAEKVRFNESGDREFTMANKYAAMPVRMDYGADLPIEHRVFLRDDQDQPDPPETVPGQFGHLGFIATGWERMDTKLHHMALTVSMQPPLTTEEGLKEIRQDQ